MEANYNIYKKLMSHFGKALIYLKRHLKIHRFMQKNNVNMNRCWGSCAYSIIEYNENQSIHESQVNLCIWSTNNWTEVKFIYTWVSGRRMNINVDYFIY